MLNLNQQPRKPPVWGWYVAFCAAMAVMWLALVVLGLSFIFSGPPNREMSRQDAEVVGLIFIVLGVALMAPYVAAPFLPRRRWAWVVGVVLIVLSMTGTCCLPAAIPLLIWWVKPETKEYFGGGRSGAETSMSPSPVGGVTHKKCPGCGLNNVPAATRCERCGAALAV
ncbi:MAG TPA: hypothetical protein VGX48_19955 [Pyrinomonadaceae bacterium]|jgi:hypothetical protein|nr:hypothetical protein [Pyrinomonadaceae bacterium]